MNTLINKSLRHKQYYNETVEYYSNQINSFDTTTKQNNFLNKEKERVQNYLNEMLEEEENGGIYYLGQVITIIRVEETKLILEALNQLIGQINLTAITTNIPTLKEFKAFKNLNGFTFKPIEESFHDGLTLHTFENNVQVLFSKTPLTKEYMEFLKSKEKEDECFIIQESKNNNYFVIGIINLD